MRSLLSKLNLTVDEGLTVTRGMKWQEECAAISRKKARHKRRSAFRRRAIVAASILVPAYIGIGGWWLSQSDDLTQASDAVSWFAFDLTRHLGFEVQQVRVEGLETLPATMVARAADIMPGEPIFKISVKEAQARIEALPEIRHARVERSLPDVVRLIVQEREPYALWQKEGKQLWIDRDGTVLHNQKIAAHQGDLVLVGEDVPQAAEAFLTMIDQTPELRKNIIAAQRIGGRRWDVEFTGGITVKLPQQNQQAAWQKLAQMVQEKQLMERAVQVVDMRQEDRVILTLQSVVAAKNAAGAKGI